MCRLSYRACEGLAVAALGQGRAPDHTSVYRRLKQVGVSVRDGITTAVGGRTVMRVIPDGTGLEPSTRSDSISCQSFESLRRLYTSSTSVWASHICGSKCD